jgi:two-component system, cell cycle sensor histidine kinase and response regulator CckA
MSEQFDAAFGRGRSHGGDMLVELRVLVLEDNIYDAELAIAMLDQAGYSCRWDHVATREAFLMQLERHTYDLVISDYSLPAFDGLTALHLLRARDLDMPFILVSGTLGEETAIESLKAGATDYVIKTHLDRLVPVVGRALRERDEQRQRHQAEAALRRAEARYRDLFENANDMIYTRQLDGVFTSVNGMAERLTGYSRDELLGMQINQIMAPEYLGLRAEAVLKFQDEDALAIAEEIEFLRKDGTRVWVEVSSRLIYEDGQPVGLQGIARDIGERRRAETERRQLEDQLLQAQKMESIGTLAGGVAHDFNNMLTAILGNLQLVLDGVPADDDDYPLLIEIEKAATRATALTRQLLAFSRRQPIERRSIDLNATINELSQMLRRIIGEDVEIAIRPTQATLSILADPAQVQQVIMNLAVNARDAMPGGGCLTITTGAASVDEAACRNYPWTRPGRYVQIVVSDTGVGMDSETQQRMFEPFFTTKPRGKGTGLGLSVVYGIVKQHEGFILVDSKPGQGATFTIFLPAPAVVSDATGPELVPTVRGGHETILVAEDEASLRNLAATVLERLGYTVLLARDGQEAVDVFRNDPARVDLVILDLVMPRFGGRDALAHMRNLRPDLRALFVTGYDDGAARVLDNGGSLPSPSLLMKPYRVDALGSRVRELLDN